MSECVCGRRPPPPSFAHSLILSWHMRARVRACVRALVCILACMMMCRLDKPAGTRSGNCPPIHRTERRTTPTITDVGAHGNDYRGQTITTHARTLARTLARTRSRALRANRIIESARVQPECTLCSSETQAAASSTTSSAQPPSRLVDTRTRMHYVY